ncbi:MAG: dienelactone hydrolase family protein [Oceanospirillaceae bacterium]|nr:dienelactone hydrolase family protein [Oceanospirillaceae bacterium]
MKFIAISLVLLFSTFTLNARSLTTHTVSRGDSSNIIYYLLSQSNQSPSDTLLLILQGSDCNSVQKIESIFADYMNVWPIADVLLIEKYGIDKHLSYSPNAERPDCPVKYLQNDSPEQRVADVDAVMDTVLKNNNYSNVIVLGGSEGAVIANLVTARGHYINATISFNGGGRYFIDDVIHSIKNGPVNNDAEVDESIKGFRGFADYILNSEPTELAVSGHGYDWWYQMLTIDQLEVLKKVKTPLLIIQGGRDLSVSPQKVDEMILALKESEKQNIEYRKYKELNHGLNNNDGESERKEVVQDINVWLKSKLSLSM